MVIERCLAKHPSSLVQLIEQTGYSRATLFNHLRHLRDSVFREPLITKKRGRPRLTYRLAETRSELQDYRLVVRVNFRKLKDACGFHRYFYDSYCKQTKKACSLRKCPLLEENKLLQRPRSQRESSPAKFA